MIAATCALVIVSQASAPAVLAEWRTRYAAFDRDLASAKIDQYGAWLAPEWTLKGEDGKPVSRASHLASMADLFASATKVEATTKVTAVSAHGATVDVEYDATIVAHREPSGGFRFHDVGVDGWRRVKGSWKIVKTVERKVESTDFDD